MSNKEIKPNLTEEQKQYISLVNKLGDKFDFNVQIEYKADGTLDYVYLEKWTDMGEDWIINLDSSNIDSLVQEIEDMYEGFDPEEDAQLMLQARGNPGLRGCLQSSDEKDKTLKEMSIWLDKYVRTQTTKKSK